MIGREAYEADLAAAPLYHDGTHREPWSRLDALAQWSWERKPTERTYPSTLARAGLYYTARANHRSVGCACACAAMLQAIEAVSKVAP